MFFSTPPPVKWSPGYWILLLLWPAAVPAATLSGDTTHLIQIVFTSDVHYGITRHSFDGDSNVDSHTVNARMVEKMNHLPSLLLPPDKGVNAGQKVGAVDYIMIAGDIANRQETPIQSATASWTQFAHDYLDGITLKDHQGNRAGFLLVAGNHDVSNAIGYYKQQQPPTDPASLVGIYNTMLHPAVPKTSAGFHYPADKINYSKDIGGIHFLFVNIWPDSANRIWMEKDLAGIDKRIPVIIVAHDPPDGDAAHFINPNGAHTINAKDRFENLLEETSKDIQDTAANPDGKPQNDRIEQEGFVAFLQAHPNIRAYFHGHNNWNQFYTYTGPGKNIHLAVFRADSPMKGKFSSKDETQQSFQLISIDTATKTLTARECLWNTDPDHPGKDPVWGKSITVAL